MGNLTPQFDTIAKGMACNPNDARSVEPLQVSTYHIYVPLYDACLFTSGNMHYYPQNMNINIFSPQKGCVEFGNPVNITVSGATLMLEETLVPVKP